MHLLMLPAPQMHFYFMAIHIVIDGYNLIRQSHAFSDLDRQDLQMGREALVDALAAYKLVKPYAITVVFDGGDAPGGMPRRDRHKGIDLRYSNPGELADNVIKRMAASAKEKLLVVSSDLEVVQFAAARGATTISAPEFEERLMAAQYEAFKGADDNSDLEGWQPTTKKKGPARRLPKRQRKMRRKISKL